MARTIRTDLNKVNAKHFLRRPAGAKQAKVQGARAVPPTSWDDINIGSEAVKQAQRRAK